jgi:hypothetical protein
MTNPMRTLVTLVVLAGWLPACDIARAQTSASGTAGPNVGVAPAQPPIDVAFDATGTPPSWKLQVDLIVNPDAGPLDKRFLSPRNATGAPILLDAQQPFPQIVWEDFLILPVPGTPGVAVTDWHEEIRTPGWEWVIPGDTRFPTLFPPHSSLITRNGAPWPWTPIPMDPADPAKLWVAFPPIKPNEVLDVHKALLWVGTDGNRIWGDGRLDDGTDFNESFIGVREYPTIPEPASIIVLSAAIMLLHLARRR